MIGFANAFYLWTFVGIVVPLAIHLLSKKQATVIYAGSLRHFSDSASKQFKSIRLNELLLLAFRIAIVVTLTLYISGFHWSYFSKKEKWLLLEPGVEKEKSIAAICDSLQRQGYERRWLIDGFPAEIPKENQLHPRASYNYWHLSNELKFQPISDAVIFYRQFAVNFSGSQIQMPAGQKWIAVDASGVSNFAVSATEAGDSVRVRIGHSSATSTFFESKIVSTSAFKGKFVLDQHLTDSLAIESRKTIRILFHTDANFANDEAIIRIALKAIAASSDFNLEISDSLSAGKANVIFWLSDHNSPLTTGVQHVSSKASGSGQILWQTGYNSWAIKPHLTNSEVINDHLTVQLARIIQNDHLYDSIVNLRDLRVLSGAGWTPASHPEGAPATVDSVAGASGNDWLFAFLIALFVTERFISWRRNP